LGTSTKAKRSGPRAGGSARRWSLVSATTRCMATALRPPLMSQIRSSRVNGCSDPRREPLSPQTTRDRERARCARIGNAKSPPRSSSRPRRCSGRAAIKSRFPCSPAKPSTAQSISELSVCSTCAVSKNPNQCEFRLCARALVAGNACTLSSPPSQNGRLQTELVPLDDCHTPFPQAQSFSSRC
jgi:hypothetical protein